MGNIVKLVKMPAISISPEATVQAAVNLMADRKVGAVTVMDGNRLVGIFSERDLVNRVVAKKMSTEETKVSRVMTSKVRTVSENTLTNEALKLMHEGRFRHLPVVDTEQNVVGMLSVRDLLRNRIEELDLENKSLAAFISADGPGG